MYNDDLIELVVTTCYIVLVALCVGIGIIVVSLWLAL